MIGQLPPTIDMITQLFLLMNKARNLKKAYLFNQKLNGSEDCPRSPPPENHQARPLSVHWQGSIIAGAREGTREEVWEQQQLKEKVGEASTTRGRGWGGSITSEQ
jgi:hypothetical protein